MVVSNQFKNLAKDKDSGSSSGHNMPWPHASCSISGLHVPYSSVRVPDATASTTLIHTRGLPHPAFVHSLSGATCSGPSGTQLSRHRCSFQIPTLCHPSFYYFALPFRRKSLNKVFSAAFSFSFLSRMCTVCSASVFPGAGQTLALSRGSLEAPRSSSVFLDQVALFSKVDVSAPGSVAATTPGPTPVPGPILRRQALHYQLQNLRAWH